MKKKIIWSLIIVCLMASIWGGARLVGQMTCPVWDRNAKECRQCDYSYPVFMGKTAVESRCANREIKQNCCKTGYYSIPAGYVAEDGDFNDCKRYFSRNIFDLCPVFNRILTTFRNPRAMIFILGVLSVVVFIPFWIVKKIRKKCWGYLVIKRITKVMMIAAVCALLLSPVIQILDYEIGHKGIFKSEYEVILGLGVLFVVVFIPLWIVKRIRKNKEK